MSTLKKILRFPFNRYPLSRVVLWTNILSRVKGVTAKDTLAIAFSGLLDMARSMIHPFTPKNPVARFPCKVHINRSDAYFYCRASSDDIYFVLPEREQDVHNAILDPLTAGDVFVDVGANIGYYSVLASKRVGSQGTVVAVEAMPDTLAQLMRNIGENHLGNIRVVHAVAWSKPDQPIQINFKKGYYGQASTKLDGGVEVQSVFVRSMRVDDICESYPSVKVLKLDVEGAELEVMKGALTTLSKTEFVVAECDRDQQQIIRLLSNSGFTVRKLKFTSYILGQRAPRFAVGKGSHATEP